MFHALGYSLTALLAVVLAGLFATESCFASFTAWCGAVMQDVVLGDVDAPYPSRFLPCFRDWNGYDLWDMNLAFQLCAFSAWHGFP